jgi:quinol monooxygenase YgiN
MIYEIAEIDISEGHTEAFEAAVAEASAQFKAARGCLSLRLGAGSRHRRWHRTRG